jgi:Zn-dependent protease
VPAGVAAVAAVGFVLLLFGSVLLHELGHALTARRLGIRVRGMTLWALGGYTEMEHEPRGAGAEFLVALAGPLVSFAVGGVAAAGAFVLPDGSAAAELAGQLAFMNLTVAVFNLLPGLPLDGGALVRAGVWRLTGDRNAGTVASGWAGRAVAVLVILGALALGYLRGGTGVLFTLAVGVFLWLGASQAIRAGETARRIPLVEARALARPALAVPADVPLAEAGRRAVEAGVRDVVVTDSAGTPVAVVSTPAAAAVPVERRPWVPVSSVARSLEPGMIVPAHLRGEPLLRALRAHPASEYVVEDGDRVVGVLVATDVAAMLDPGRGPR